MKRAINQLSILTALTVSLSSCIILTSRQYDEKLKNASSKEITTYIHNELHGKKVVLDTCDLTSLLKVLSQQQITKLQSTTLDANRINKIKDELIKVYNSYKLPDYSFVINENDLQAKVKCYLDYILNPKYDYVPFYIFWKDSYYLKFPCKN